MWCQRFPLAPNRQEKDREKGASSAPRSLARAVIRLNLSELTKCPLRHRRHHTWESGVGPPRATQTFIYTTVLVLVRRKLPLLQCVRTPLHVASWKGPVEVMSKPSSGCNHHHRTSPFDRRRRSSLFYDIHRRNCTAALFPISAECPRIKKVFQKRRNCLQRSKRGPQCNFVGAHHKRGSRQIALTLV